MLSARVFWSYVVKGTWSDLFIKKAPLAKVICCLLKFIGQVYSL